MACKKRITYKETISCAKVCKRFNENPIANFSYESYVISDNSQYFDDNIIANRQVRWRVYVEDILLYTFGYGFYNDIITELSNGSTYANLILGNNNNDIINFLNSLPFTILEKNNDLLIEIDVIDDSGVESLNESNKYKFTI